MKYKKFTEISQFFGEGTPYQCSENEADSVNNTHKTEEFERCVLCGELTAVPISMPVEWREDYEIGCGQLCAECAKKQREETERGHALFNEQILQAVRQRRKESNKK